MFSRKNKTIKNLIFGLIVLLVAYYLASPVVFKHASTRPTPTTSSQETIVTSEKDSSTSSTDESNSLEPQSNVQGASTQKSSPTKSKTPAQNLPSNPTSSPSTPTTSSTNEAGDPIPSPQVSLTIDAGSYGKFSYQVPWVSGMSVWDVLSKASTNNKFEIKDMWNAPLKSYYIQGLEGNDCECWLYKVDGTCPSKGVSLTGVNENSEIYFSVNNICS